MAEKTRHMAKRMVKNGAGAGDEDVDLRKFKAPPTGAMPTGTDQHETGDVELEFLDTTELRERAIQLAIPDVEHMDRDQIMQALLAYWRASGGGSSESTLH